MELVELKLNNTVKKVYIVVNGAGVVHQIPIKLWKVTLTPNSTMTNSLKNAKIRILDLMLQNVNLKLIVLKFNWRNGVLNVGLALASIARMDIAAHGGIVGGLTNI